MPVPPLRGIGRGAVGDDFPLARRIEIKRKPSGLGAKREGSEGNERGG